MCGTKKYAHKKQESVTSICKDNLVVRWKAAERCVEAENQLVLANVNLDKVSISELFKIGVDLNDMSSVSTMPNTLYSCITMKMPDGGRKVNKND